MLKVVVDSLEGIPEAVQGMYKEKDGKFHLQIDGLEDVSGLKSALNNEREAVKMTKKQLKELEEKFDGIDADQVKSLMRKFEDDGEAKLISEGKIDQVIEKRLAKRAAEFDKQLRAATEATESERQRAGKFTQLVLDNHIREAAAKAGLHNHAIEDALFRARSMFKLTDDGKAVQFGDDGAPVIGKDGKSPFSPSEWLEGMKESAPHWFPAGNAGGGAAGSKDSSGNSKVVKRADFNEMPPHKRAEIVRTHTIID